MHQNIFSIWLVYRCIQIVQAWKSSRSVQIHIVFEQYEKWIVSVFVGAISNTFDPMR